jgi:hypothetical protein
MKVYESDHASYKIAKNFGVGFQFRFLAWIYIHPVQEEEALPKGPPCHIGDTDRRPDSVSCSNQTFPPLCCVLAFCSPGTREGTGKILFKSALQQRPEEADSDGLGNFLTLSMFSTPAILARCVEICACWFFAEMHKMVSKASFSYNYPETLADFVCMRNAHVFVMHMCLYIHTLIIMHRYLYPHVFVRSDPLKAWVMQIAMHGSLLSYAGLSDAE